jgi:aldehyde:ferredoxin oxidoreductase
MNRLLLVVACVVMMFGTLSAQGMRMSPEERANALKDSLSLDSVQTKQVVAIYKESQQAMMNAFQSSSGDREAMRGTMQEITKKADDKVKALLNDGQKKKFEAIIKNRPARGMRSPRN